MPPNRVALCGISQGKAALCVLKLGFEITLSISGVQLARAGNFDDAFIVHFVPMRDPAG